jgi:hypothetical protein
MSNVISGYFTELTFVEIVQEQRRNASLRRTEYGITAKQRKMTHLGQDGEDGYHNRLYKQAISADQEIQQGNLRTWNRARSWSVGSVSCGESITTSNMERMYFSSGTP